MQRLFHKKYNNYLSQFLKTGGTGKQSMSGAMLMLADELANDCIFKDDLKLTINDFQGIILSETEASKTIGTKAPEVPPTEAPHFE